MVLRNSKISERTFRLWIQRFNESCIDRLTDKSGSSLPRLLNQAQIE